MKTVVYLDDSGVPTGYAEFQGPITDSEFESGTVFDDGLPDSFENIVSRWRVKDGVFQDVGSAPSVFCDWTESGWVFNVEKARTAKRSEIKRARDAFEFGGFDWSGYCFDSNAISQQRIQGAVQLAMAAQATGEPFSIEWTLADNSVITLDGGQMLAVGLAMGQHIQAAHGKARLLKQRIDAAQSIEEFDSIAW